MTTPLNKQPLAQACKEAKGPIEFHSAVVHTAKEINELANAWKRIQELRAAAHPKALEMKS